jgi:hypothetical protein
MSEPRWRHYCPKCTFLGSEGDYDLYYCRAVTHTSFQMEELPTPRFVARGAAPHNIVSWSSRDLVNYPATKNHTIRASVLAALGAGLIPKTLADRCARDEE